MSSEAAASCGRGGWRPRSSRLSCGDGATSAGGGIVAEHAAQRHANPRKILFRHDAAASLGRHHRLEGQRLASTPPPLSVFNGETTACRRVGRGGRSVVRGHLGGGRARARCRGLRARDGGRGGGGGGAPAGAAVEPLGGRGLRFPRHDRAEGAARGRHDAPQRGGRGVHHARAAGPDGRGAQGEPAADRQAVRRVLRVVRRRAAAGVRAQPRDDARGRRLPRRAAAARAALLVHRRRDPRVLRAAGGAAGGQRPPDAPRRRAAVGRRVRRLRHRGGGGGVPRLRQAEARPALGRPLPVEQGARARARALPRRSPSPSASSDPPPPPILPGRTLLAHRRRRHHDGPARRPPPRRRRRRRGGGCRRRRRWRSARGTRW